METPTPEQQPEVQTTDRRVLPAYEPPTLTRYTDQELLEALGPAQAASYGPV